MARVKNNTMESKAKTAKASEAKNPKKAKAKAKSFDMVIVDSRDTRFGQWLEDIGILKPRVITIENIDIERLCKLNVGGGAGFFDSTGTILIQIKNIK